MYIHLMTMCMHLQASEILLLDNSSPTPRRRVFFPFNRYTSRLTTTCNKISDVCGAFPLIILAWNLN